MTKTFGLREIVRLGLLKNHKGEPYKHHTTVRNLLRVEGIGRVEGVYGLGYEVTEEEIKKLNARWG